MRREAARAFKVDINVAEEKKTSRVRKGNGNWWYGKAVQILRMSALEFKAMKRHLTTGLLVERKRGALVLEKATTPMLQFSESSRSIF